MSARLLVVDDEEVVVKSCQRILGECGYTVDAVRNGADALRKVEAQPYDAIVLDIMMPGIDGMEVLQRVKEAHPDVEVIMVTGLSQIETAVRAMKLGAFDYVPKPFDPDQLAQVVKRALEHRQLRLERLDLAPSGGAMYRFENIVGSSPPMQDVFRLISQCAPTSSTVMITGDSGTGKELIARAIHHNSLRKDQPFVAVDCNSLSETLLESELFGHVKGSFTGATSNKRGMFEIAQGGTLFLDEIGNISLSTQAKLLRIIQEREFRAVGDTRSQGVNIRLITATNRNLRAMIADGTFREDLYYRINIFPIQAPSLKERREDIPALAFHFLNVLREESGRNVSEISEDAMTALVNYEWPGNVRELENAIHRAIILATGKVIRRAHLTDILEAPSLDGLAVPRTAEELKRTKKLAREKSVEDIERLFVLEALKRNAWNVTRSAAEAGMQRANFQALMKKHDIRIRGTAHGPDIPEPS